MKGKRQGGRNRSGQERHQIAAQEENKKREDWIECGKKKKENSRRQFDLAPDGLMNFFRQII